MEHGIVIQESLARRALTLFDRRSVRLLTGGLLALQGVLLAAAPARAATPPDLSGVVLSQLPLSGFVATPPGPTNGPINQSNVAMFVGGDSAEADQIMQMINSGSLTAYIRVWAHQPPNATSVVIEAIRLQDPTQLPALLAGVGSSQGGTPTFLVPSITDASGYDSQTTVDGAKASVVMVTFSKGDTAYVCTLVSANGSFSHTDAIAVASAQDAAAPGSANGAGQTTPPGKPASLDSTLYKAGEVFGGVLVVIVVVGLVVVGVRRKTRTRRTENHAVVPQAPEGHLPSGERAVGSIAPPVAARPGGLPEEVAATSDALVSQADEQSVGPVVAREDAPPAAPDLDVASRIDMALGRLD